MAVPHITYIYMKMVPKYMINQLRLTHVILSHQARFGVDALESSFEPPDHHTTWPEDDHHLRDDLRDDLRDESRNAVDDPFDDYQDIQSDVQPVFRSYAPTPTLSPGDGG